MNTFDFDTWVALYKKDPLEFEAARTKLLTDMLASSNIETEVKLALKSVLFAPKPQNAEPMAVALEAQKLMWTSFSKLQATVKTLHVAVEQDGRISCRSTAVSQFTQ